MDRLSHIISINDSIKPPVGPWYLYSRRIQGAFYIIAYREKTTRRQTNVVYNDQGREIFRETLVSDVVEAANFRVSIWSRINKFLQNVARGTSPRKEKP